MPAEAVTACVHIDAPPERVYEYFTRPEAIVSWLGEHVLLEAEPGGRFALDIKGTPVRGRFLELDPPRRLLISWGYAGSDHLPPGPAPSKSGSPPTVAAPVSNSSTAACPGASGQNTPSAGTTISPGSRLPPSGRDPGPTPACHRPRPQKAHHNARMTPAPRM